jgi:hypothetical protein
MPRHSNLGDSHILGDFGVGVTQSMAKIDLSRAPVHLVQSGDEFLQPLLAVENVIGSDPRLLESSLGQPPRSALRNLTLGDRADIHR